MRHPQVFASIDQEILLRILGKHISDRDTLWLLSEVIGSFKTAPGTGLPLGNLTSQLLVNVYMNEFDKYVKYELRRKYYVRYADDFVFLSESRTALEELIPVIANFLEEKLKLSLHPNKVYIKSWASGVDFLGWVSFPDHRVLRSATKRRMLKNIAGEPKEATIASYLGMLQHGNAKKLEDIVGASTQDKEKIKKK
jgi:RNA-directed DNA polymerase